MQWSRTRWVAAGVFALVAGLGLPMANALRTEGERVPLSVATAAEGLMEPMGLAVDPRDGQLYVAERAGNRISRVSGTAPQTFIGRDFSVVPDRGAPEKANAVSRLEAPTSIAMDDQGFTYAVDGAGEGRLLRFSRPDDGVVRAVVLSTPLDGHGQMYSSVSVDRSRKMYVTAQQSVQGDSSGYGAVLLRHPDGAWWMVDYGPLARFSNVAFDPKGEIMVVAERLKADAAWYHAERHWMMGSMDGLNGIRHVAVLADGTSLAALICGDGTWCLVEMDAARGVTREWLSGLGEIGGLAADVKDDAVYVSLPREGRVLRVTRAATDGIVHEPLRDLELAFQGRHLVAPREWPSFFKQFMDKLGVVKAIDGKGEAADERALTVEQFTDSMPVVAGKFKARMLSPPEMEEDPVEEISFLILYPKKISDGAHRAQPSVSLMRAVHRSGAVRKTTFLGGGFGGRAGGTMVTFPTGFFVPPSELGEKGHCRVCFVGMGMGPDYWMDIHLVHRDRNMLVVEKSSKLRIEYVLDAFDDGGAVLVAGSAGPTDTWFSLGHGTPLSDALSGPIGLLCRHAAVGGAVVASAGRRAGAESAGTPPSWKQEVLVRAASSWGNTTF
jgi:hypothetical protein